jgi:GH15 family glucan-1,4-alpha-glucosidase
VGPDDERTIQNPPSISEYALLGDCHGAALVSSAGSVDWWSPQRFDAPSVFTRILDPGAGHWHIAPTETRTVTRRYVEGTMVLETEMVTDHGSIRLTDALLLGAGERGHQLGWDSPQVLVRRVEGLSGQVNVELKLLTRPEYGLVMPSLTASDGLVEISGGADRLTLTSTRPVQIDPDRGRAHATYVVVEGDSIVFTLHHRQAGDAAAALLDGRVALADTVAGWQSWTTAHRGYDGAYREEVMRSALVLQALTYRPTGAVVAAPTTSLPEVAGGTANWDYRFGWLRDGSFTLKALWVAACPEESERFFDWIAQSCGPLDGRDVPVMLGARGERDLSERTLDHLSGYNGARPVRVGNDAWRQNQLDVYGEVLDSAWILRDKLQFGASTTTRLLRSLADRAAETWQQRDAGIWAKKMAGLMTLRAGQPEVEVDPSLGRLPDEPVISKKYASAFFGTDLLTRLNSTRVDTLLLAGCTTSGCVRATAVDAVQNGLRPMVVGEAVGDRSQAAHEQSLFDLQAKYADVVSTDEVLEYLAGVTEGVRT